MTGHEFFRNARESRGYSAKTFAVLMEISPSNMYEYERGNRSFAVIPVYKAIRMFDEVGISLEEFFDVYYPYKDEIDKKMQLWKHDNPREYQYQILKQRLMTRFSKMKARKNLPQEKFDDLYYLFTEIFEVAKYHLDGAGNISETFYDDKIMTLLYEIKKATQKASGNVVSDIIQDEIDKTEYVSSDIAKFIGMDVRYFYNTIRGRFDFQKFHVLTALKLCYVLNLDIHDVFCK